MKRILIILLTMVSCSWASPQGDLEVTDTTSGLRLSVINKECPLLNLLLPHQLSSERGIEIEFPEHVTGVNKEKGVVEHLYLASRGSLNRRTLPVWSVKNNTLTYETILNDSILMVAKARLDSNGIKYSYQFTNQSNITYQRFQAVTCVKLYSCFSDNRLERTYIHDSTGFDLLASETPERLTMPLSDWLPCRYHASYSWPVPGIKKVTGKNGITKYYRSTKVTHPFIATLSHDNKWIVATYTLQPGNLWTNPARSCQHADPEISLYPHKTKTMRLTTFVYRGDLDMLFRHLIEDKKRYSSRRSSRPGKVVRTGPYRSRSVTRIPLPGEKRSGKQGLEPA